MRPAHDPARILIAEDEAEIASLVEKGLHTHGFRTAGTVSPTP
ncbi:response regulator transcription factor [Streptomyces sp. TRM68367]|nr:response regulator transcription factor [Streptomyces sp. TRM68367]MBC9726029.1 response regulator transcription factor [Streptomyces sp. TRM68367]